MVAEVTTGNGFRGTLSYVQKEHEKDLPLEKKPEIIERNNVYGDTKKMAQQMRFVSNGNTRASKPVMHLSVNFHKDEKLTPQQEQKAVKAVLSELGIKSDTHQYFIAKHKDAGHPHYHIVLNKVSLDGQNLNTDFIKNRLQGICDKIEQQQDLRRTEGRTVKYDPTQERGYRFLNEDEKRERAQEKRDKKAIRNKNPKLEYAQSRIKNRIRETLESRHINTPEQFKQALASKGVDVKFTENKNGISGVSFKMDNVSVKGSRIDTKWSDLDKALTTNAIMSKENEIRAYIEEKAPKTADTVGVVDQAIREKMPEINPNANPWETWNKNPQNEKLFNSLHQHAVKMQEQGKQQKTAFEIAKESREGKQQDNKQEKSQSQGISRFDDMKAKREEKSQDRDKKRGFGR